MIRRILIALAAVGLLLQFATSSVHAHGARVTYQVGVTVEIWAEFDNGEPMSNAQVVVFSPADPETPWLTATTDEDGRFEFKPDMSIPGDWDVQVRQAGHGDIVHIPIGGGETSSGRGLSVDQVMLMVACVIWGAVGTALFFRQRGDNPRPQKAEM